MAFGAQPPSLADWESDLLVFLFERYHGQPERHFRSVFTSILRSTDKISSHVPRTAHLASMYVCI